MAALLQMCFIYWFSAALKTGLEWRNGTAIYYAFSFDQLATPLGRALLAYPNLLRQLTIATVALEAVGPTLALLPLLNGRLRLAMVIVFIGLHVMMGLCLTLGIFPLVCAAGWMLFVPPFFWDTLSRRYAKVAGERKRRIEEVCGVVRRALVSRLGARNEARPFARTWTAQTIAGFFLVYVFCWNLRTVNFAVYSQMFPMSLNGIGFLTHVDQVWGMFAPYPSKEDGWYVVPARLADGTEVDVFRNSEPVQWEKPATVSSLYPNERWQKYMENLWQASNSGHRIFVADYWRRQWNSTHEANRQVKSLKIYYMLENTPPEGQTPKVRRVLMATFNYQ